MKWVSNGGKRLHALLIAAVAFWPCLIAHSQVGQMQMGAKVLSAKTDGHNIIITVYNVSKKDIAALHLSSMITFQDGRTGGPGWIWDLAVGKMNKAWRSSHHIPPGDAPEKGVLHPGESLEDSLNWDTLLNNPLVHVSASVDVVMYSDGSADTLNQEAYQLMISRRRGLAANWGPTVDYENSANGFSANRQLKNQFFSHVGFPAIAKQASAAPFPEVVLPATATLTSIPALPTQQSDLIVVGKVIGRQAFLSTGRTGIYSEIQIEAERVLKGDEQGIAKAKTIIVQRPGGVVRFTDGTVQIYKVDQQDWPLVSRRYVFFLENSQIGDFDLLTAYELCGGMTYPLDGFGSKDLPFQTYSQMKEQDFMNAVSRALKKEGSN